jgi:DNA (cytosine-5)-methyltransferase 1
MENVKGLLSRRTKEGVPVVTVIQDAFRELGYNVEVWTLNAAAFGVPQTRERIFVVGNRIGVPAIGGPSPTHSPTLQCAHSGSQLLLAPDSMLQPAVTLWEAISDLPAREPGEGLETDRYDRPPMSEYQRVLRTGTTALFNHVAMSHSSRLVERFKHVDWGESSANVPSEHWARKRDGSGDLSAAMYSQNNRRLHPHRPSQTIAASFYANFLHPYQHRNLTAREGARIQSFPDSYRFLGKKTVMSQKLLHREGRHSEKHVCQYSQIGNAVPPILASAIATHLRKVLTNELRTRLQSTAKGSSPDEVHGRRESAILAGDPT